MSWDCAALAAVVGASAFGAIRRYHQRRPEEWEPIKKNSKNDSEKHKQAVRDATFTEDKKKFFTQLNNKASCKMLYTRKDFSDYVAMLILCFMCCAVSYGPFHIFTQFCVGIILFMGTIFGFRYGCNTSHLPLVIKDPVRWVFECISYKVANMRLAYFVQVCIISGEALIFRSGLLQYVGLRDVVAKGLQDFDAIYAVNNVSSGTSSGSDLLILWFERLTFGLFWVHVWVLTIFRMAIYLAHLWDHDHVFDHLQLTGWRKVMRFVPIHWYGFQSKRAGNNSARTNSMGASKNATASIATIKSKKNATTGRTQTENSTNAPDGGVHNRGSISPADSAAADNDESIAPTLSLRQEVVRRLDHFLGLTHAFLTGFWTHFMTLIPWYSVLGLARGNAVFLKELGSADSHGGQNEIDAALVVLLFVSWILRFPWQNKWFLDFEDNDLNDWYIRDHWLGHHDKFEFNYMHGPHHDALPCGMIAVADNGPLEGVVRHYLGHFDSFLSPPHSFFIWTKTVIRDMVGHQYIPGVFPFSFSVAQIGVHHIEHHYLTLYPIGNGIGCDPDPRNNTEVETWLSGNRYTPDNPVWLWFSGKVAQHEKKLLSEADYADFKAKGERVPDQLHVDNSNKVYGA